MIINRRGIEFITYGIEFIIHNTSFIIRPPQACTPPPLEEPGEAPSARTPSLWEGWGGCLGGLGWVLRVVHASIFPTKLRDSAL